MSSVTRLSSLSLQHNSLSYNLEDSYASDWPTWWPHLTHLDLSDNYLSGTLPAGKGLVFCSAAWLALNNLFGTPFEGNGPAAVLLTRPSGPPPFNPLAIDDIRPPRTHCHISG